MRDRLYVKRLETPSGNVAHEVVALVSAEAVAKAAQDAKDAQSRARKREADAEATRAHRARSKALWDAAEAWIADNVKAAESSLARMDAALARIGQHGRAGW